jgi:hypothetical protein
MTNFERAKMLIGQLLQIEETRKNIVDYDVLVLIDESIKNLNSKIAPLIQS